MTKIFLESFLNTGQNGILRDIERKIGENSAWVIDHRMLSSDSATLTVEINKSRLSQLITDLQNLGIVLNTDKLNAQIEILNLKGEIDTSLILYFVINYLNKYPKRQIELPAV